MTDNLLYFKLSPLGVVSSPSIQLNPVDIIFSTKKRPGFPGLGRFYLLTTELELAPRVIFPELISAFPKEKIT